jgi:NAD(P)-dependent dehydrogenase (short-subunit alcohol dehydrogenase family)
MSLDGSVALVTGANSGIGHASAMLLAREGARIGALGRSDDELERTVAEIEAAGGEATALVADVSDPDAMRRAVDALAERWGRLDIVVANAGVNGVWAPIDELEPEEWDTTLAINLRGTFLTFKYAVPHLKVRGGSVIVVSSIQGTRLFSSPGTTAYACSKGAQIVLMKKMALELAPHGIRVNAVCPGATDTDIDDKTERRNLDSITPPVEFPEGKLPLMDRSMSAEEVARVIVFLASGDSGVVTGTEIWVDAGTTLLAG